MIKFHCSGCGQKLGVADSTAGKRVRCKQCAEVNVVPSPQLEPAWQLDAALDLEARSAAAPHAIALEPAAAPPMLERSPERVCSKCRGTVSESAAICVNCGNHLTLNMNAKTVRRAKFAGMLAGRTGLAVVGGGVTAVAVGAAWAGIAVVTGYEIGWVAIGLGFVVGLAVALIAGGQSDTAGLAAGSLAVVGLLVGKLLIFQWGMPSLSSDEEVAAFFAYAGAIEQLQKEGALSAELVRQLEDDDVLELTPAAQQELDQAVEARLAQMTAEQKRAAAAEFLGEVTSELGFWEKIRAVLSPWDAIWTVLAVVTAYKVGSGTTEE